MATQDADHKLQPGIYQVFNFVGGTAIDLSGHDRKSIIGFPAHEGSNQKVRNYAQGTNDPIQYAAKWQLSPLGKGYSIRSLNTGGYLTIEDGIRNGVPIVASAYPVSWALEADDSEQGIWRVVWPNTGFLFDLASQGDSKPGTLIQLWERYPFEPCRLWRFVLQRPTPGPTSDSSTPLDVFSEASPPESSNADTVVKLGDVKLERNGESVITTTTTTVTTVTKVVKLSCP